jgi:hypothetical protein
MAISRNSLANPRLRWEARRSTQSWSPQSMQGTASEYSPPLANVDSRPVRSEEATVFSGTAPLSERQIIRFTFDRGWTFPEIVWLILTIRDYGRSVSSNELEDMSRTRNPRHQDIIEIRDALAAARIDPSIQGDPAIEYAIRYLRDLKQQQMQEGLRLASPADAGRQLGSVAGPAVVSSVATRVGPPIAMVAAPLPPPRVVSSVAKRVGPPVATVAAPVAGPTPVSSVAAPVGPALSESDIVQYLATNGFGYYEIVYVLSDQRLRRMRGQRSGLTMTDLRRMTPTPNHQDLIPIRDSLVRAGLLNDVYRAATHIVNQAKSPSTSRPNIGTIRGFSTIGAIRASGAPNYDLTEEEIVGLATIRGWTFPEIVQLISQKRLRGMPISSEDMDALTASRDPNDADLIELKIFLDERGPFPTVFDAVATVIGHEKMGSPEGVVASGLSVVVYPPGHSIPYYPSGYAASGDAASSARELHQYISTTPANRRDRERVRRLQQAIGVSADGLFGQGTATKIFELTGLRLPGFTYPQQGQPGQPGQSKQPGQPGQPQPGQPGQPPAPSGPSVAETIGTAINGGLQAANTLIREANATRRAEIEAESRRAIAEIQARNGGNIPAGTQDAQTAQMLQAMMAAIQAMGSRDPAPPPPPARMSNATIAMIAVGGLAAVGIVGAGVWAATRKS